MSDLYGSSMQFPALEDRTLPSILAVHAEQAPDRAFLQFGDAPAVTFAEMELASNRIARALAGLGVARGDRVAIFLRNCAELVQTWFGAAKLGAVEVPINVELRGKLLDHVLRNSGATVLVVGVESLSDVVEVVNAQPTLTAVIVVGGSPDDARAAGLRCHRVVAFAELETASEQPLASPVSYADPMAILYTSGTTGPAKGALMPHHQYYLWVELYARNLGLTAQDSYFTPLPLFHADAQLWGVYFPLVFGTKGTLVQRFSASRYWDQVRASAATATNMLGAMAHILWKQPPSPQDAANPLRVAQALPMISMKTEFEQRFDMKLVTAYGQTETNWVSYDTVDDSRSGSCGRVNREFFDVQIVDEHDEPVAPGTVGQIVVRPKQAWSISLGYYNMPSETQQTWRNLWFHSGDAGRIDDDDWLYFVDRIKDVIRVRGSNISAFELESVVADHPDVLECAAIAVTSELSEDDVFLIGVRRPGAQLTAAELSDYCRANLPRFMVPRYVDVRDQPLPRTPTEKIAKTELRQSGLTSTTLDTHVAAVV